MSKLFDFKDDEDDDLFKPKKVEAKKANLFDDTDDDDDWKKLSSSQTKNKKIMDIYIDSLFADDDFSLAKKEPEIKPIQSEPNKVEPKQIEVAKPIETKPKVEVSKPLFEEEDLFTNSKASNDTSTATPKESAHEDAFTQKEEELFGSKKSNVADLFPDNKSTLFSEKVVETKQVEVKKSLLFEDEKPVEVARNVFDEGTSIFGSHKKSTLFDDPLTTKETITEDTKALEEAKKKSRSRKEKG